MSCHNTYTAFSLVLKHAFVLIWAWVIEMDLNSIDAERLTVHVVITGLLAKQAVPISHTQAFPISHTHIGGCSVSQYFIYCT